MTAIIGSAVRAPSAALLTCLLAACWGALPAAADDEPEPEPGWSFSAELSLVATDGNAESSTFGVLAKAKRTWSDASFELATSGLRANSTTTARSAIATAGGVRIVERSATETTAERYSLNGRYNHDLSARLQWFVGSGWERDELAGFRDRFSLLAGVGHRWFDTERTALRTDYGVTYTQQDDVVEDPARDDGFFGARLAYDYRRRLSASTSFESRLGVDLNLDDTDDLRADAVNSLAVSISDTLALKVGLQLLYDRQPALTAVAVENAAGVPTGDRVLLELEELDSTLTVALVFTR